MQAITALLILALAGAAVAQPAATPYDAIESAGKFKSFLAAADKAGLTPVLKDSTLNATFFIPNDEAFAKLPAGTVAPKDLLLYHAIPGAFDKLKLLDSVTDQGRVWRLGGGPFESLAGPNTPLKVTEGPGPKVFANGLPVTTLDLKGGEAIIHELDTVLTPPPALAAKIAAETAAAKVGEATAAAGEAAAAKAGEAVAAANETATAAVEGAKAEVTKAVAAANETAHAALANATHALNATVKDAAAALKAKVHSGAASATAAALLAAVPAALVLLMA